MSMASFMIFTIPYWTKFLITKLALVWLFTCMYSHMY